MKTIEHDDFWKQLYYIRLRDEGKIPAYKWGGYDQDFARAEHVLEWDDLASNGRYGYIGHKDYTLGVIDIDCYKDECPDLSEITHMSDSTVVKTPSGGFHFPFLHDTDLELQIRPKFDDFVDLKGEINHGHAVFTHNTGYRIAADYPIRVFQKDTEWYEQIVQIFDEGVLEKVPEGPNIDVDAEQYEDRSVYEFLDSAKYPPGERAAHPFHGSSTDSNFMVSPDETSWRCWRHEATGGLVHLLAMKYGIFSCGEWGRLKRNNIGEWASRYKETMREANMNGYDFDIRADEEMTDDFEVPAEVLPND